MRASGKYWIGIDGEGLGRAPHRYVLLAASDQNGGSCQVYNPAGLTTHECLSFLIGLPAVANLGGYYLGYDWTMILRDLPDKDLYVLLRPELRKLPADEGKAFSEILWEGWRLHYLSGSLRITRGNQTRRVWDLGKFFQSSFIVALERWGIPLPQEIVDMKARRDQFDASEIETITRYCLLECRALAELATELQKAHEAIGVKPKAWYGPGSSVTAVYHERGIKERLGKIPEPVTDAAEHAFFGGRFENAMMGQVQDTWSYDIVSAYPYQLYHLPCLEHGRWERLSQSGELGHYAQAVVRYELGEASPLPWGPLPCRLKSGSVIFPLSSTTGWVWASEFHEARKIASVRFVEAWGLTRECNCQPFHWILDLFRERVRVGKDGKGIALKLIYNSAYGKLAQRVGDPQFGSIVWAGMITSGCRAQLLRAMRQAKDMSNIVAVATDGLYSRERLDLGEPPLPNDLLGSWEEKHVGPMTFVRPGIYWAHEGSTVRARGLGRRQLEKQRDAVTRAIFWQGSRNPRTGTFDRDIAHVGATTVFGGARACIYRVGGEVRRSDRYGEWHQIPARVSLSPKPKRDENWEPPRIPYTESAPYRPSELELARLLEDIAWASL